MTEVESPIRGLDGNRIATLRVGRLPGRSDLLALENECVVVEEEGTYVFQVDFPGENRIQVEPGGELFSFDDASNTRGRLLPKQHVGRINVAIRGGASDGLVTLSVRPKKLEQDTEYRRMLDDIAETATEGRARPTVAIPTVRLLARPAQPIGRAGPRHDHQSPTHRMGRFRRNTTTR